MRHHADGRCPPAVFREILSGGNHIHFVRRGSHLPVSMGLYLQVVAVVWVRGDAPLHRDFAGGVLLSLEERGVGLEPPSRTPGPPSVTETPDLEKNPAVASIRGWCPDAITELISFRDELTLVVPREHLRPLAEFLADDATLAFTYLSDITCVDRFLIEPRF